ncbi:relaxase/mobilization nuclease domain-containing protein [Sphingobacterium spiritivorum]|uniref:relaxase/mobilization nuclease domain-containing protein n=1 Tax=Sphingobacterium spiritivorum TaxID=258 RepID=UPI003DA55DD5
MIVKILKKSATFKAVRYNTGKVEKDRGELLLAKNFGLLQGLEDLRPQDYINYLEAVSARSTRTKYPQFHVAISTKGQAHSRDDLADIAQKWMDGMGYGQQPYLLIYHKDTLNNHVHLVSTRVGRDGKKISDRYEKLRAYKVLNQVMGEDEKLAMAAHLQKALGYSFSTRAQFMMLLEAQGYALTLKANTYAISKYGSDLGTVPLATVYSRIAERQKDRTRVAQLRAIIRRYAGTCDPALDVSGEVYRSELAVLLQEKFGIQVLFHGSDGRPPHGYTLIDHAGKSVYKGGEIMPLAEFIASNHKAEKAQTVDKAQSEDTGKPSRQPRKTDDDTPTGDAKGADGSIRRASQPYPNIEPAIVLPTIDINISDDVDDEAIHGRNRRRKQKARTNTR